VATIVSFPPGNIVANLTDVGNSIRLATLHGHDIAYSSELGWMVWNGKKWQADPEELQLLALAKETVRAMLAEAAELKHDHPRQALVQHALHTESASRLKDMIFLARDEVIVEPAQFDANPWLLNVQNGTLDLKTATLHEHRREDYLSHLVPVDYNPDATCPNWEAFLARILPDPETRRFVQKAVGYTLTGLTTEQCLFFMYGTGSNGKSTFINRLTTLLGEYATNARIETFMDADRLHSGSAPTPDLADLRGARLVVPGEVKKGHKLDEARIKDLTGGDPVRCRVPHQRTGFTYQPQFKLWLFGNHKPRITSQDHGIWRRQRLIPFEQIISDEERDSTLKDRLDAEAEGILLWAVRGCMMWQREGLDMPPEILAATQEYREEMDPIGDFLESRCYHAAEARVSRKSLWDEYQSWAQVQGEQIFETQNRLTREMKSRHYKEEKINGERQWVGIGLKKDQPAVPPAPPTPDTDQNPIAVPTNEWMNLDTSPMDPCLFCGREATHFTAAGQPACEECFMEQQEKRIYLRRKTDPADGETPPYEEISSLKWFGQPTSVDVGRVAWEQLGKWVKRNFPQCHLQKTPVETGLCLIEHSLPWAKNAAPYQYPVLDPDLAKLIASTTTQHRVEALGKAGANIEQIVLYDARVAHAAHLRHLPVVFGQVIHDQDNVYIPHRRGRYYVDVTVPRAWTHIGLVPFRSTQGWCWPNVPGQTFVTWCGDREVELLKAWRWSFTILERILFTPSDTAGADPLRTFSDRCLAGLERLEQMEQTLVVKALRAGLRAIVLHTIGNFFRSTRQDPIYFQHLNDVPDDLPPWAELERAPDGRYVVKMPKQLNPYFARWYRPEWAASIWEATRVETTKRAMTVDRKTLLAIDGDGLYLTDDPKWTDDGRVGTYRWQHSWQCATPWTIPVNEQQLTWLRSIKQS